MSHVGVGPASAVHVPQSIGQLAHVSPPLHVPLPHDAVHEPQSPGHVEHVSPAAMMQAPLPHGSAAGAHAATAANQSGTRTFFPTMWHPFSKGAGGALSGKPARRADDRGTTLRPTDDPAGAGSAIGWHQKRRGRNPRRSGVDRSKGGSGDPTRGARGLTTGEARQASKCTTTYQELQRYMLLLKDAWKLGPDGTVAVVLEDGQLHFQELHLALPGKGDKKKKNKKNKK